MAAVEKSDIPEIASFMSEFWTMIKDYWTPEIEDEYWTDLFQAINSLVQKYPYEFCRKMCIAYLDYLDLLAAGRVEYDTKRTA